MVALSCVTTFFNEGALLHHSIRSVLAQEETDFELILVDDGADDATRAVAESYADPRIRLIRQANDGLSAARNRGLSVARGGHVCFLDADDTRPPWALAAILRQLSDEDPDLLLCPGHLSEETGRLGAFYDRPVLDALDAHLGGTPGQEGRPGFRGAQALALLAEPQSANKVVRRALLQENGIGFPNGHYFEDIHFHALCIAAADRLSVGRDPAFTYHRRTARRQITASRDALRFDILAVMRLLLDRFAMLPEADHPACRTALMLSLAKLVRWSEDVLSHHLRAQFREAVPATLALCDPRFRQLAHNLPPAFTAFDATRAWLEARLADPRLAPSAPPIAKETEDDRRPRRLPRLWPTRRA